MPSINLCTCRDAMEAHFIQAALDAEQIPATIIGESLQYLSGSLPAYNALPQIWINPADHSRATQLLATLRSRKRVANVATPWTCPHCEESIEPQFTQCWKCQTPRPADDAPPVPATRSNTDPTLDTDLPCLRWAYNLRGLPPAHPCPECGLPLLQTLLAAITHAQDQVDPHALHAALRHLASTQPYPTPAVLFLLEAYSQMLDLAGQPPSPNLKDINVPFFCDALARHATDHFGTTPARALEQFTQWNLHTTTDLARALSILWGVTPDQAAAHFHPPRPFKDFLGAARG